MIIITGAAGFIGSNLVYYLNEMGQKNLILVDDFSSSEKHDNLRSTHYLMQIDRGIFLAHFENLAKQNAITAIYHLGARTDTTAFDWNVFKELNINYTKYIFQICTNYDIPLVYASSAATYGLGEYGYIDRHDIVEYLSPLNPYGKSKNDVDKWILTQEKKPSHWYGLKFFNVYGPNEYHKKRMASVIFHAFHQIIATSKVKLFRSHRKHIAHGHQKRDFIYVKDVVKICHFLMEQKAISGIYNVGTGTARTFLELAKATFAALNKKTNIEFIDTPQDIRDKYQYFTEADMRKMKETAAYPYHFYSLEAGVDDYINNYLLKKTNKNPIAMNNYLSNINK